MQKQESLFEASKDGDEEKIVSLLNDVNEDESFDLTSGLILSADEGHDNVVKIFLDHGVNINNIGQKDGIFRNKTALMRAAASGHFSTVELLLEKGADMNQKDSLGTTAMMFAAERKFPDIVSLLLRKGADRSIRTDGKIWRGQRLTAYEGS